MRAHPAVLHLTPLTIPTKNLYAVRVIVCYYPPKKFIPLFLAAASQSLPVRISVIVDMIQRQKLRLSFSATSTPLSVSAIHFSSERTTCRFLLFPTMRSKSLKFIGGHCANAVAPVCCPFTTVLVSLVEPPLYHVQSSAFSAIRTNRAWCVLPVFLLELQ